MIFLLAGQSEKELLKRSAESADNSNDNNDNDEGFPPFIELLRGRDGRDGRDGESGTKGSPGVAGEKGDTGSQGPPGPRSGGVTYIRWGRTTCRNTPGTELVYSGRAAGTHYTHKGGTSDYLCLPETPQYSTYRPGVQGYSPIYGAEYEIEHETLPLPGVRDDNVPCALCRNSQRSSVFVFPARVSCPSSWTREYFGYLMTDHIVFSRRATACVDKYP